MKLFILIGFLYSVYCLDERGQKEFKIEERRVAGGGNYGGFIGLTTYVGGPALVKGKYERDNFGGFSPNWKGYGSDYIQADGEIKDGIKKSDENIEYLGYRGGYGYCSGVDRDRDGYGQSQRKNNYSNYYDDETRNRCDYLFGYTGPTANDEPENLIRPCALDDWQCIRKFFAANSKCKPAYGPIPDPLIFDIHTIFFPVVNITVAAPNLMIRGLSSAKIRDFYVNSKSGNLVVTIEVNNLNETIPRAYYRYRRTAKESIVLADISTTMYGAVTFTVVIPKVPNLRLDLADIHPDVQDAAPPYFIGPGNYNSTDPDVVTAFTQFNLPTFIQTAIREILTYQAPLFMSIYIQENICDFGLKLVSV